MAKHKAAKPDFDWTKFPSSMPLDGIVQPKGKRKATIVARLRHAWRHVRVGQPA